jgi:serine phosphatase RsbU (regulator of sigma subunit)
MKLKILYTSKGNYDKAVALGLQGMKLVGIRTPQKVSEARLGVVLLKLYMSFWNKKIEDLADVPMMTDPEKISYGYLVSNTGTAAYYTDANLFSFIVARSIPTLMKAGNYEFAPFMYNAIGGIIGSGIGLYKPGYRFGLVSLKINDKMPGNKNQCRSKFLFALVIQHWIKHARHDLEFYRNAYKDGLESGDHIFAGHSVNLLGMTRIILGDNIDEILEEYGKYADFQKGGKDPFVARNYTQNTQMCLCLKGVTDKRGSLNSGDFSEDETIAHYRNEKNSLGIFYFSLDKLRIHYLFGEYDRCLPIAEELYDLVKQKIAIGNIHVPEVYFYYSLVLTALYPSASPLKKIRYKARLKLNQMKMKTWARDCPDNFLHKYLLIEAETAAINMKTAKAAQLFDRAIKSARENRYTQNEAIASERAALFMMKINNSARAASYLKEAHYGFIRWGAAAKVNELEEKFPQLATDSARGSRMSSGMRGDATTTMTASGGTQTLDLHAIMKSSQALAGEIDLGRLLAKIMKLSIENAGAQYAYLILENEKDKKLYIEASAGSDRDIEVLLSLPIDGNSQIASSIVNYVKKTGENIVLNNAAADKRFVNDSYIASVKPKSLLCAPIKNKGVMAGILYLENNLTTNAFTPDRLQLLMILSGQAAISIENSRLVAHRENAAKLSTEMKIAANIQDALLPENPAIEGFDIITYMKPADDVGGDYYDIINVGGFNWVIIGDVSGHGVPAGLIMMMVQTSIQVVVRRFPETAPSDLLAMINEAIRYNVGKMKEEKYMTITAFSFTEDGRARHSGLHQDLLIYRLSTDSVEVVESKGIWLSPWELWSAAADSELHLAQGDVLLLYTDGITEARSPEGEMFSAERLAGILAGTGKNELDQIRGKILDSLNGYVTDDDVTMVILRKK